MDSKCNKKDEIPIKATKIVLGTSSVGVTLGGLALITLSTGGLALPLIGSALVSAGVSSTFHTLQNDSINAKSYLSDVGAGALIGVFTGGLGASLGVATGGLALCSSFGAAGNVGAKVITEAKECTFNGKSWFDFGKTTNQKGEKTSSWLSTASVGAVAGASGLFNSNLNSSISRIGATAITSAAADAVGQGINIATGGQEKFELKQTIKTAAVSSCIAAGQEVSLKGIYKLSNGSREDVIVQKTNKQKINEVPIEKQNDALKVVQDRSKQKPDSFKNYKDEYSTHKLNGKLKELTASDLTPNNHKQSDRLIFDNSGKKFFGLIKDHRYNVVNKQNLVNAYESKMLNTKNDISNSEATTKNCAINVILNKKNEEEKDQ